MLQRELALSLAFETGTAISRLEASERSPSAETLLRAAHLFNVLPEYFLLDSIPPQDYRSFTPSNHPIHLLSTERFGERLRALRIQHDLTQHQLAARLHVSRALLSNLELGNKQVVPGLLALIVTFFEVPVLALFTDDPERTR
jgi:transcriptional regulator with XRE-family HTH domain